MAEKIIIATDKAPAAIGTYSQAVKVGSTVYLSGQIPLDPATMHWPVTTLKPRLYGYSTTSRPSVKPPAVPWPISSN